MTRPLLLDTFCGAGGAAMGYHRAGFDVVGVDINPQKNYPFEFVQGDALETAGRLLAEKHVSAVHASPPCHDHTPYIARWGEDGTGHLLSQTRRLLESTGLPWVIENVVYRGYCFDDALMSYSWTLDKARARWFANRLRESDHPPAKIASGFVAREHVIAYLNGRDEQELVLLPEHVQDLEIEVLDDQGSQTDPPAKEGER